MINIYFDMDGVLAEYVLNPPAIEYYTKGFFRNLNPINEMIDFAKSLMSDYSIHIASTLLWYDRRFSPSRYCTGYWCEVDKLNWLREYLPELAIGNIHLIPHGTPKNTVVKDSSVINILIDDYTPNLESWETKENCYGVKLLNGINNTNGTWLSRGKPYMFLGSSLNIKLGVLEGVCSRSLR